MKETKNGLYIYVGKILLSSNKIGFELCKKDDITVTVTFYSKKHLNYAIGELIELNFDKENMFTHKTTNKFIETDMTEYFIREKNVERSKIEDDILNQARKNRDNIENMSLKDLKKYASQSFSKKRIVVTFLRHLSEESWKW